MTNQISSNEKIIYVPVFFSDWEEPPNPLRLLENCEKSTFSMRHFDFDLNAMFESKISIDEIILRVCRQIAVNEVAAYLVLHQKNISNDAKLRAEVLQSQDKFYLKKLEKMSSKYGFVLKFKDFSPSKKSPLNIYLTCDRLNIQYTPRKELTDEELQVFLDIESKKFPDNVPQNVQTSSLPSSSSTRQPQQNDRRIRLPRFEELSTIGELEGLVDSEEGSEKKSTKTT